MPIGHALEIAKEKFGWLSLRHLLMTLQVPCSTSVGRVVHNAGNDANLARRAFLMLAAETAEDVSRATKDVSEAAEAASQNVECLTGQVSSSNHVTLSRIKAIAQAPLPDVCKRNLEQQLGGFGCDRDLSDSLHTLTSLEGIWFGNLGVKHLDPMEHRTLTSWEEIWV